MQQSWVNCNRRLPTLRNTPHNPGIVDQRFWFTDSPGGSTWTRRSTFCIRISKRPLLSYQNIPAMGQQDDPFLLWFAKRLPHFMLVGISESCKPAHVTWVFFHNQQSQSQTTPCGAIIRRKSRFPATVVAAQTIRAARAIPASWRLAN